MYLLVGWKNGEDSKDTPVTAENLNHMDVAILENSQDIEKVVKVVERNENELINRIYPVGSIYMSVNNVSPATFIGGAWERIQDRFLLSAGSSYGAGTSGGSATNTLTAANMPAHTHTVGAHNHGLNNHAHSIPALSGSTNTTGAHTHRATGADASLKVMTGQIPAATPGSSLTSSEGEHSHTVTTNASTTGAASGSTANSSQFNTGSAGSGTAVNNMPPYLTVYMWKRTA